MKNQPAALTNEANEKYTQSFGGKTWKKETSFENYA
jgi:hypothetical protein